ncbi:hypothetical protein GRZ55_06065 [Chelativorans sp. ZYF759]|uniref:hypothetical protein n=1 Tax=Chelativorans sp. ZYF759 TaxID=2692213 RepID=UPI00145CEBAE|nr:hypothetical protein [Chelativorans sp. ZYF759]NMG38807.1 hypothetical protein [Chelativorans sp. ZYF759]
MVQDGSPGAIRTALAKHGLRLRGGIDFGPDEPFVQGPGGRAARSVLLVGNAGDGFWPHFQRWAATQPAALADPLDAWSRLVLEAVAETCGAHVIMPNDKPFAPFQQWAMRAEGIKPSPLGILMHPEFGLWHAYRGALLFDRALAAEEMNQEAQKPIHLCELCVGKPCLNACPAGAFGDRFDHGACGAHIASSRGRGCMEGGCLARHACPHRAYRYGAPFQAFLMRAFRKAIAG